MSDRFDQQAAEFVRRASLALNDTSARVSYAIHHIRDHPWFLLDQVLKQPEGSVQPTGPDGSAVDGHSLGQWTETLSTAGYGAGTVIMAGRDPSPAFLRRESDQSGAASATSLGVPGPFQHSAAPNPSFLYRGARNVETAIYLPMNSSRLTTADGVAIATTIRHIAEAAKERECPIAFLQIPTSSLPENEDAEDTAENQVSDQTTSLSWQPARRPGIRFAVALPPGQASDRLEFFQTIEAHGKLSGGRVAFGDFRGDRRGGIWLDAVAAKEDTYRRWAEDLIVNDSAEIELIYPVTFVGPARVGSTYDVMRHLANSRVPVVSATIGSLKDLAFIHLGLGCSTTKPLPRLAQPAGIALQRLGRTLGDKAPVVGLLENAHDYIGYMGPSVPVAWQPEGTEARSVWAAWQLPHRHDALLAAFESLRDSLREALRLDGVGKQEADRLLRQTNVEYAVCRRVETGELKGRCKLALPSRFEPTAGESFTARRTELCRRVEAHWRSELSRTLPPSSVEVEFTWRERWLGRWSNLLAGSMS